MSKKEQEKTAATGLAYELYVGVVSIRASSEMMAGLDEMAAELANESGISCSRSDMARKILREAIAKHRRERRR
jgi:metal-responsive CopG/Arc/MetJ family transcriptional regulator